ncbi:MAG: hypothetical protein ACR5K2_02055 [Wolbachia sp.]
MFTISALVYGKHNKASQIKKQANQIDGVMKVMLEVYTKDTEGNFEKDQNRKLKLNDSKLSTCADKLWEVHALNPIPKQQIRL